jgi:class 3 adenylate cyclase
MTLMKVLLVEDEQSMLFTLSNLLKHRGYEVIAAESAEKGLEELGDGQVDLVISDLRLPGMDGISLIAEVRERCEDVVPIIISAYGTLGNAIDALKLSVCDFLRKPFDLSTFEETLSRAEQRRNQLLAYKKYISDLKENLLGEERRRTMLSRFVSKRVVDRIMSSGELPARAGQTQKVSVLFADISDFTGLSEKLDQKSLVFIVNTFYAALENVMVQYGGNLDKFMGDGIMMVFGNSTTTQENACHALEAAVKIQGKMDKIRQELQRFELPEISIHIGVCTGTATACSIGTEKRLAYTHIGDAVNLAKRLQDLAGPGEILVSEATVTELADSVDSIPGLVGLHPLQPLAIKGKKGQVVAYRAEFAVPESNDK